jgi:hypothetical protein
VKAIDPDSTAILDLRTFTVVITDLMKRTLFVVLLLGVIFLLASCADREIVDACLKGHKYSFFGGFWHGLIAPFDLIAMLFKDNVTVFAQNNDGFWYSFGFILGSGGWGFLGGRGSHRRRD